MTNTTTQTMTPQTTEFRNGHKASGVSFKPAADAFQRGVWLVWYNCSGRQPRQFHTLKGAVAYALRCVA